MTLLLTLLFGLGFYILLDWFAGCNAIPNFLKRLWKKS
jgi:hypothetical protein